MGGYFLCEGVQITDLSLTASGTGPGCSGATISPKITETKLQKSKFWTTGKYHLENIEVKIICPGTGGASQSNCTAAKVQSKGQAKYKDSQKNPVCVGDVAVGGVCSGSYPVGNSTSNCSCNFSVNILKSQKEKGGIR